MSRRPVLTADDIRKIREIAAIPPRKRRGPNSLRMYADMRGVNYCTVRRAAQREQRCYENVA